MLKDEFPKDAADAHLVFGGKLVVGISGALGVVHRMVVDSLLPDLVAQVDEGDAVGVLTTFDELEDAVLQVLVVEKDVDWIGIVVHGFSVLVYGAKIGQISESHMARGKNGQLFFRTYL